ncbi:MAG TPA: type III-B CRISPR module-associated protein Cmr3 [Methylomusa anaerophila]|uniref:CRISPR-associated protein n=1 Tax=Methylomusa anaerophila TaxID=1930071 RepID=A0A348ALW4_9FIRM|nr:type III-B CRISPR module-associated protein Cmr3 [Methylomusa anaerophila]BBB92062.1 CRISPR-associated protein [Methylomusa anaerophila]HML87926.1 type III-B CRISPR module-associated protein Cmr3 [Methylomusa anaerophila]
MIIEIRALDTLFFRDGKPFTMGAETWANGIFPPAPSVLYGALRSAYFAQHPEALAKVNSADDPTAGLVIRGYYLKIGEFVHFLLPGDCVVWDKDGAKVAGTMALQPNEELSSCPLPYMLAPAVQNRTESIEDGLLDDLTFEEYLDGFSTHYCFKKMHDYVLTEAKIGIARSYDTRTTEESRLYRIGMRRLESSLRRGRKTSAVSMVIDFSGMDLLREGIIRLGGEGKAALYQETTPYSIPKVLLQGRLFKLYLATPAIFENGWVPGWIDSVTMTGTYNGVNMRLICAAIGKFHSLGGWDMDKCKPKPMRRAVPAGSVYYFETETTPDLVLDVFHGQSISDYDAPQGFGIAYVGAV